jgi:hypothetical protein
LNNSSLHQSHVAELRALAEKLEKEKDDAKNEASKEREILVKSQNY